MKDKEEIIANTVEFVKKRMKDDATGHDWWHVHRVWKMAIYLAEKENANMFEVQLAALLHDIEDWKLIEKENKNGSVVNEWLISQQLSEKEISNITEIIENVSFKGAGVSSHTNTIEGQVVQDADRLDAIGAIGIARAFTYAGSKNREMHNPDILPVMHQSFDDYKRNQSTTINHFYEKLLLLKDRMNTETAKEIAKERHHFLEGFLKQFIDEWNVEK
jgi:uncharacterized protein